MPLKTKIFTGFVSNGTVYATTKDAEEFCNKEGFYITHVAATERFLVITTEKKDEELHKT